MKTFLLAFRFLTRLPLGRGASDPGELPRAVAHFPAVGIVLGGVLAACAFGLEGLGRPLVVGALLVTVLVLLTGGLHLDGVADWFDALGGGRGDAQRMMAIMRDPHVGAHGTSAVCLVIVGKVVLFAGLAEHFSPAAWLALPAVARATVVLVLVSFPSARDEGLARTVRPSGAALLVASLWLAPVLTWFWTPTLGWSVCGAVVTAVLIGWWARARIGGVTGDVCGAAIELAEVAFAATWLLVGGP